MNVHRWSAGLALIALLVAACASPRPSPTLAPSIGPSALPSAAEATAAPTATPEPTPATPPASLTVDVFGPVNSGHWTIVATDRNLDGQARNSVDRLVGNENEMIQVAAVCTGTGTIRVSAGIVPPSTSESDPAATAVPLGEWLIACPHAEQMLEELATPVDGGSVNLNVDPSDPSLRYDVIAATVVGG